MACVGYIIKNVIIRRYRYIVYSIVDIVSRKKLNCHHTALLKTLDPVTWNRVMNDDAVLQTSILIVLSCLTQESKYF